MNTSKVLKKIADEISTGRQDLEVWTWALAEAGGDAEQAKAHYVQRRMAALAAKEPDPDSPEAKLARLRAEIRRQLALQNRKSLYSVLGVPADAGDTEIARTIALRVDAGASLDPETRYALEILGNPEAREQFDRNLLGQLSTRFVAAARASDMVEPDPVSSPGSHWQMWLAAVLVVLGAGYLWQGHSRDMAEREVRLKEVEAHKEEVRLKALATERMVETRAMQVEATIEQQQRANEQRERLAQESIQRQDRYNFELALRQEQRAEQVEQRRVQAEQARALAEARRRDAEAQAATRMIRQQAIQDAMARGNHNEAQRLRSQQY
ncbi:MAG: hypothetical protein IPL72_14745 [Sulfuritalea sp.]|nr:hypothetical protein [Sulfuritalea sp.]